MHFLETCFFFSDFFLLKLILGGQFFRFLPCVFFFFSACIRQRGTDGGEDRGIVGGSPATPRRLEVVLQPVRFFDLTPGAIAGIYAESAGARGGPGQGRHSNVGAGSGTGTRRRIIVQWHSHRRPAGDGTPSDRRRSGLPTKSRGPSFTFASRCLKLTALNGTTPSGCPPQTTVPFLPHDDFEMSPEIQKATGSRSVQQLNGRS